MSNTCRVMADLDAYERECEANDLKLDRIEDILDDWAGERDRVTEAWDDLMNETMEDPAIMIEYFVADDGAAFMKELQSRFKELLRDEAEQYLLNN